MARDGIRGVIVTLALGIGLMALVFISSRRGYDEVGCKDTGTAISVSCLTQERPSAVYKN